MIRILSSYQMRNAEKSTMEDHHIPSLILMERAALSAVDTMAENNLLSTEEHKKKFVIVCGPGNNGADGVAVARMLHLRGERVSIAMVGNEEKYTDELKTQIKIAKSYDIPFKGKAAIEQADVIIDAVFGIGLSRDVTGTFAEILELINTSNGKVVSLDIPSGYDTDTGRTLGVAVKADLTVTFSYIKKGLMTGDCYLNRGKLICTDAGIYVEPDAPKQFSSNISYNYVSRITDDDLRLIPKKTIGANKGSYGKLLVIAGSENIYGAAYLSAKAAMEMGCGYVKVFTHANNVATLMDKLPEAVCIPYKTFDPQALITAMNWTDAILIGPGLSTSSDASEILNTVLNCAHCPILIDADALNILSQDTTRLKEINVPVVITPHLQEMSRLCGDSVKNINLSIEETATIFANRHDITVVLKNYTTFVADKEGCFFCDEGSEALATAGSGDVLAGIIAALLAIGIEKNIAAALGVYIHAKAGNKAAIKKASSNLLASEIIDNIN